MSCPILPSHRSAGRGSTIGWLASTSVAALLVSAIGAWALSNQSAGNAIGDAEEAVLIMLAPVPAVEAMREPSPDAVDQAPSEQVDAPDAEDLPETPELTEAPDLPEDLPAIEEIVEDLAPEIDQEPPPKPVVELPKPKPRPERAEEKPVKKAEKPREKTRDKPKRKASENRAEAKASSQPAPAQASAGSGQASAKSYAASVMKKVNRTRKKNAGEKGTATVSFTISAGGGLAAVSISRSSGSARVDEVALDHIRRAAPFPAPPAGVNPSYSFNFVAK
ncbi:energy transducer TonB family protein [Pseudogemmobacter faecipullorum]|uniref:TonB family protein n=1 Tax=Pseudogemmobacter faecipullorum TaxID=2755041 RepID=A0ABS8CPP5_9RHOB|nr:TonB family protein [Pseudogemmobacter faecipullorum]MCB5411357.1 TonB family protein [Pseudogemmobacter faecipullorum]